MTRHKQPSYAASWVPWDDQPDRERAEGLAVRWVLDQAATHGGTPILATRQKNDLPSDRDHLVVRFAARYQHATVRGGGSGSRGGPVLAYLLDVETLEHAIRLADGSSLCVLEYPTFRLGGWAAAVGAVNLLTGQTAEPLDAGYGDLLEALHFAGNNGYADRYGERDARRILGQLQDDGLLDPVAIVGYLAARGVHASGQKRIQTFISQLAQ